MNAVPRVAASSTSGEPAAPRPHRPLRIAIPLMNLETGGGLRVTLQYAQALAERGHQVTLIAPEGPRLSYFGWLDGVRWVRVRRQESRSGLGYARLVAALAASVPPSEVVVSTSWQAFLPAWWGALVHRARHLYLIQSHYALAQGRRTRPGLRGLVNEVLARITYWMPSHRICVSRWLSRVLAQEYGVRSAVVSNGVDLRLFRPLGSRDAGRGDHIEVLVLGRPGPLKGFDEAVAAIRAARVTEPRIALLLVTRDKLTVPTDIPSRLVVPRSDEELVAAYNSATLLLFTSQLEGFGLPPLEAMACGTPVVMTPCGGVEDYARDAENCVVSVRGDPAALASDIVRVVRDPALAAHLVAGGLATAALHGAEQASLAFCEHVERLGET